MTDRLRILLADLAAMEQVSDARPVTVTIRDERFEGVRYLDAHFLNDERYYLLGALPTCYRRSARTCFQFGTADDWYVACHSAAAGEPARLCGAWFLLCRWQVPGGEAIDWGQARPYARVAARVENGGYRKR